MMYIFHNINNLKNFFENNGIFKNLIIVFRIVWKYIYKYIYILFSFIRNMSLYFLDWNYRDKIVCLSNYKFSWFSIFNPLQEPHKIGGCTCEVSPQKRLATILPSCTMLSYLHHLCRKSQCFLQKGRMVCLSSLSFHSCEVLRGIVSIRWLVSC